jgi:hypothetical protein
MPRFQTQVPQFTQWDPGSSYLQGRLMRVAFDAEQEQRQMEREAHVQRLALGKAQLEALQNPAPELRNVPQGTDVYNPGTGQVEYSNPAARKDPNIRPQNYTAPDGSEMIRDTRLNRSTMQYEPIPGTERRRSATQRIITGTPEEMARGTESQRFTELKDFQVRKDSLQRFQAVGQKLVNAVARNPGSIGTLGSLLRTVGSLQAQATQVVQMTGLSLQPLGAYSSWPAGLETGVASAEVQTRFLTLALLNAAANGQTNRALSDRDLQLFSQQVGADTGSPRQVFARLQAINEDNTESYQRSLRTAFPDEIPPGLQYSGQALADPFAPVGGQTDWNSKSDEAVRQEWERRHGSQR